MQEDNGSQVQKQLEDKTGWMVKEGSSVKTWKRRYFILRKVFA
jgi:hypothetical protein